MGYVFVILLCFSVLVKRIRLSGEAVGNEAKDRVIYTEDERISVSLELSTG